MTATVTKRLDFIPNDGYTIQGYIKAEQNLHGEFRFSFRPTLIEERSQLVEASGKIPADAHDRQSAALMAKKLTEWSLVDEQGQPVKITAGNVLRLVPRLFTRLFGIVAGFEASDSDPTWPEATARELDRDQLESALSGSTIGLVSEARNEKN